MTQAHDIKIFLNGRGSPGVAQLRAVTDPPTPLEGSGVYAIDRRCIDDCERVLSIMREKGPPRLRAVMHKGELYLLEGSHRAVAAQHLGLTIKIELLPTPVDWDKQIESLFGDDRRPGDDVWGRVECLFDCRGPRVEVAWRVVQS